MKKIGTPQEESSAVQKPTLSHQLLKQVSPERRAMLENEARSGLFFDPGIEALKKLEKNSQTTPAGNVIGFSKKAEVATNQSGYNYRGTGGTVRQGPNLYSPLWLMSNINLPRDRATINSWCRAYYAMNAFVQNAISLHATYPISKLSIKCKDKKIQNFFEEMNEELNLSDVCTQVAQEYWTLGEAFPYAELNQGNGKWSRITLQNPDYIMVTSSPVAGESVISLRPDESLKRLVTSNKPADIQQRQKLDKRIVDLVKQGKNIPLDNFYISHLARNIAPYDRRGTGLLVSCFKALMIFDKAREAHVVQADNMINPMTLIKVGGATGEYKPTPADLEAWREVFENATSDPDFKIITHDAVSVERVGWNSGILDTSNMIQALIKEIYIGLLVPSVLMDGGADTTYANGGVALDVLKARYFTFRNLMTRWLRRKIFAPISKLNDFYERVDGKKILVVPDVDWNHMSLFDAGDYVQTLKEMAIAEKPKAAMQTLYRSLGLDYLEEQRKIRREMIDRVILEKEEENLKRMGLPELRALTDDDTIPEIIDEPLPGEDQPTPGEDLGGGEMPGIADAPPADAPVPPGPPPAV